MVALILDELLTERLKAERAFTGADRFDEVWDGTHLFAPIADDEHQELQAGLGTVLLTVVGWPQAQSGNVYMGVNVSDRSEQWELNYRWPDVAVFLPTTRARNLRSHWVGGSDLTIEIVTPQDRTREKLAFYAKVGVQELLIVDRNPWALELYRPECCELKLVCRVAPLEGDHVASNILPVRFRFAPVSGKSKRPQIEVSRADGSERWLV